MLRYRSPLIGVLLLSLALTPLGCPAHADAANLRMQRVLARFVEQTGLSLMGVGSWITGKGFDPKSSDFDMRLVLSEEGTETQQLARWRQARTQMTSLIKEEFGPEAGSVLSRANLYAPGFPGQGALAIRSV